MNRDENIFVTQTKLAALLGVDRGTVRDFQLRGMPHEAGQRGRPARYCVPVCVHWVAGDAIARRDELGRLDGITTTLLGRVTEWSETGAGELCERAGGTTAEYHAAVGYLRGAGYLP